MTENKKLISLLKYCSAPTADYLGCERYELDCGSAHCVEELMSLAADTLESHQKRIEELEAGHRWIPVTERLPEGDNQVLAIVSGRWKSIIFDHSCELANWNSEEGWIMDAWPEFENPDVSHWMPLPEPPKENCYEPQRTILC